MQNSFTYTFNILGNIAPNCNIYTRNAFVCDVAQENCGKYIAMNATGHVTEKLASIFSAF